MPLCHGAQCRRPARRCRGDAADRRHALPLRRLALGGLARRPRDLPHAQGSRHQVRHRHLVQRAADRRARGMVAHRAKQFGGVRHATRADEQHRHLDVPAGRPSHAVALRAAGRRELREHRGRCAGALHRRRRQPGRGRERAEDASVGRARQRRVDELDRAHRGRQLRGIALRRPDCGRRIHGRDPAVVRCGDREDHCRAEAQQPQRPNSGIVATGRAL
mmetsp:Transcript_163398/g.523924  ORF Transcript_163398/g.523924 Transcript_163398/m.523924 type:complete len:219 (-) Transcript_163398:2875-3531(-)